MQVYTQCSVLRVSGGLGLACQKCLFIYAVFSCLSLRKESLWPQDFSLFLRSEVHEHTFTCLCTHTGTPPVMHYIPLQHEGTFCLFPQWSNRLHSLGESHEQRLSLTSVDLFRSKQKLQSGEGEKIRGILFSRGDWNHSRSL